MAIPLKDLDAEIRNIRYQGSEERVLTLWFKCPKPGCKHLCQVPFGESLFDLPDGRPAWKRVSGSTIEDLTLHPSYHLPNEPCGLHGWIRDGAWHD